MTTRAERQKRWWRSPWRWAALLGCGVGTTLATAWGGAFLAPAPHLVMWTKAPVTPGMYEWSDSGNGIGVSRLYVRRGPGTEPGVDSPPGVSVLPGEPTLVKPRINVEQWVGGMTTVHEVRTYAYGFPFRAMRWWSDFPPPSGVSPGLVWTPDQPIDRHGGLEIEPGTRNTDAKMLPLDVYWPGFVLDVVFWMVSMVAGVEAGLFLQRRWRVRREGLKGLCPHCGYARQGLATGALCPECGKGEAT